jgi:hypothetical protein
MFSYETYVSNTKLCSTTVIDHLERSSSEPVVYFYFDFKDSAKQATNSMMRCIASQIEGSLCCDKISPALERLYRSCQRGGSRRQPTFDEVANLIVSLSALTPRLYIVLDALDECQDRDKLLEAIVALRKSAATAKLFVTSRQESDIIEALTEDGFTPMPILDDAVKHDIELYIRSVLQNDAHLRRLPNDVKRHIQQTLIDGAKSM